MNRFPQKNYYYNVIKKNAISEGKRRKENARKKLYRFLRKKYYAYAVKTAAEIERKNREYPGRQEFDRDTRQAKKANGIYFSFFFQIHHDVHNFFRMSSI